MRFACQNCGKAYNLPEEKIATKSNVKLKCRVCGTIVEVKRQGEIVAQLLTSGRPSARVSEAPPPMASAAPPAVEPSGGGIPQPPGPPPPEFAAQLSGAQPPGPPPSPANGAVMPGAELQFPAEADSSGDVSDEVEGIEEEEATEPAPAVGPGAAAAPPAMAAAPSPQVPSPVPLPVPNQAALEAGSGEASSPEQSSGLDTGIKMIAAFFTGVVVDRIVIGLWF